MNILAAVVAWAALLVSLVILFLELRHHRFRRCSMCGGTGRFQDDRCRECGGSGRR